MTECKKKEKAFPVALIEIRLEGGATEKNEMIIADWIRFFFPWTKPLHVWKKF